MSKKRKSKNKMKDKNKNFESLQTKVREIIDSKSNRDEKLKAICQLLKDNVGYFDWVGFYIADLAKKELLLGPYVGEPTVHTRIPFGKGICGQAAERKETFLIQDVSKQINYLSCSPKVKSEIVVPISKNDEIVGQIDIDSHTISPFSQDDQQFLEEISKELSKVF